MWILGWIWMAWLGLAGSASAATLVVTNTNDSGAGSLRSAVSSSVAGDVITFDSSLAASTITLATGEIVLDKSLTIDGSSLVSPLTISGNSTNRIFKISGGITAALNGLTLANGNAGFSSIPIGYGGAIYGGGTLTITDVTFADNKALTGAAISFGGSLTVNRSSFINNTVVTGNMPGAIYGGGVFTITNSTFYGNRVVPGGGIGNAISIQSGALVATNNTFAANSADFSSWAIFGYPGATVGLKNNLFVGNAGANCGAETGALTAGPDNIADDASCGTATQKTATEIGLGTLANNGGPTQTLALGSTSAALNAGDISSCPATDQRGMPRPTGAACDVGAYQYAVLSTGSGTPQSTQVGTAFPVALAAAVKDAGGNPLAGVVVRFAAPVSGPSANLTSATAATDASGIASVSASANGMAGSYSVSASAAGLSAVGFALTNALSSNANLNTLALSGGTLSPAFAAGTTTYTANVDYGIGSVVVTPTIADANASVAVNGVVVVSGNPSAEIALNVGTNVITVTVTAQDSSTRSYTITVTRASPVTSLPGTSPRGPGPAGVSGGGWAFNPGASSGFIMSSNDPSGKSPPNLPPGYVFPHGLLDFTLAGGAPGTTATITITYPTPIPANAVYWKYGPSPDGLNCAGIACQSPHWYPMPSGQVVISGNTITLTIRDGGVGDDDLYTGGANGVIVDQGGPGIPMAATNVPTLSEWGGMVLSALLVLFGFGYLGRRSVTSSVQAPL